LSRATAPSASLAIRAEKKDAEAILSRVISSGLLDKSRKVVAKGCVVEIPIRSSITGSIADYQIVHQDEPEFYRKPLDLGHSLKGEISSKAQSLLPRGWYILGDIIIVKIHPALEPCQSKIGQALLSLYPRCRTVLRDFGIEGRLREPVREVIAGKGTETVHRENGVFFKLDACKVMFSAGNLQERMRMSRVGRDEYVIDMFAGIGYFSLPMAVHSRPARIMAIELNPVAFDYLRENIRLNHVQDIVHPILGDCGELTPQGVADRVVMGMVQVTDRYLQKGIEALRSGGILHYHQTIPSRKYPEKAVKDVMDAAVAVGCRAKILQCIRIKKYSPGVVHTVVDAQIDKDF
jgi:tRNA wybutosine-synthesizing protein 2